VNWRLWIYGLLTGNVTLTTQIPALSVFAGGALTNSPEEERFVIYRLQTEDPLLNGDDAPAATGRMAEVWVYGPTGQYDDIDDYLKTLRGVLNTPVIGDGGVACRWLGDSPELFDSEFKRAVRYGTYRLVGKVA
jgi:hypothetical protein